MAINSPVTDMYMFASPMGDGNVGFRLDLKKRLIHLVGLLVHIFAQIPTLGMFLVCCLNFGLFRPLRIYTKWFSVKKV